MRLAQLDVIERMFNSARETDVSILLILLLFAFAAVVLFLAVNARKSLNNDSQRIETERMRIENEEKRTNAFVKSVEVQASYSIEEQKHGHLLEKLVDSNSRLSQGFERLTTVTTEHVTESKARREQIDHGLMEISTAINGIRVDVGRLPETITTIILTKMDEMRGEIVSAIETALVEEEKVSIKESKP